MVAGTLLRAWVACTTLMGWVNGIPLTAWVVAAALLDCASVNSLPSAVWNSWPCWRLAFTAKNLPSLCWTREGDCTDEGELRAKDEDVPVAGLEA